MDILDDLKACVSSDLSDAGHEYRLILRAAAEIERLRTKYDQLRETNERIQKATLAMIQRRERPHLDELADLLEQWTATARADALEEAAKVADSYGWANGRAVSERLEAAFDRADTIARDIRALKETTP